MHPFFLEIKKYPDLEKLCRTDITKLPESYKGNGKIKAILLGADPTNDGIKTNRGLKKLEIVFGIGSDYENYFFGLQLINLKAIELNKDNLYIQNVCRNYFTKQTSENKNWQDIAKIWLIFLNQELASLDARLPVFVTAEKIMKLFVHDVPGANDIYSMKQKAPFFSEYINRNIFPLYRHPKYLLSTRWSKYKEHIKQMINE
jgi:hypothetical protein